MSEINLVSIPYGKAGISPPETIPYFTESEILEVRNIKVINQKRNKSNKQLFVVIKNDHNNNESQNFVDIGNPNRYRGLMSSEDESSIFERSVHFRRKSRKRETHAISNSPSQNNTELSDYEQKLLLKTRVP